MSKEKNKSRPFQEMYDVLNRSGIADKYRTYKSGPGSIDLLFIDSKKKEVDYCPERELAADITLLCHRMKNAPISPKEIGSMADWWMTINQAERGLKDLPKPVVEKSDPSLAFRRLPFDYKPYESYKKPMHFLEFCNRCSDPDVLQAFIGSIFVPESYRQQYLYIFGHGGDGKGTLFNLLEKMLGNTFIAEEVPSESSNFWSSSLVGKRLCVFPELEDAKFPTTQRFRKLTGEDVIRTEKKFKDVEYIKIFTKFILGSNDELALTKRKADMRRALYLAMRAFEGEIDPNYLDKLWEEAPAIYALCLEKYRKMCPKHGPIVQKIQNKTELQFDYESEMDRFFNTYFEPFANGRITGAEWLSAKEHYFGRRPTKEEENLLKTELANRNYERKRETSGWVIYGLRRKSSLAIMNEKSNEIGAKTSSRWPNNE